MTEILEKDKIDIEKVSFAIFCVFLNQSVSLNAMLDSDSPVQIQCIETLTQAAQQFTKAQKEQILLDSFVSHQATAKILEQHSASVMTATKSAAPPFTL